MSVNTKDLQVNSYYSFNNDPKINGKLIEITEAGRGGTGNQEPYYLLKFEGLDLSNKTFSWDDKFKLITQEESNNIRNKNTNNEINNNYCYEANINDNGKYVCPSCGSSEGGTMRIITHNFNCPNKGKKYCQSPNNFSGGKRKSRQNKKQKNSKRRNSKRRNSKLRNSRR